MTIQYCDRCGVELKTGQQSGHIDAIADADEGGNGAVTDSADLCQLCYIQFVEWLGPVKEP